MSARRRSLCKIPAFLIEHFRIGRIRRRDAGDPNMPFNIELINPSAMNGAARRDEREGKDHDWIECHHSFAALIDERLVAGNGFSVNEGTRFGIHPGTFKLSAWRAVRETTALGGLA
jgi:hypothetical protein